MTLLQLSRVQVHVDNASGSGSSPAPEGLHVWLDVPGGAFDFNHFVVHDGHLEPAGSGGGGSGQLDPRWAYWSVWSTTELSVSSRFEPVTGFGYPLPARFSRRRLILPSTRPLTVYWFNLSNDPDDARGRIAQAHHSARDFYQQLHIDVTFREMSVPSSTPRPLYLIRSGGRDSRHYDVSEQGLTSGYSPVNPDFTTPGWLPRGDLRRALTAYWVENFEGMGLATGMAWPYLHVSRSVVQFGGEAFRGPPCAYFFMSRAGVSRGHTTKPVAHEIGHCLLSDPGIGRRDLEAQSLDGQTRSFLGRLHIEGPPPPGEETRRPGHRLYDELFEFLHATPAAGTAEENLMGQSGGSSLLPWQVAVIRASEQIGDGP